MKKLYQNLITVISSLVILAFILYGALWFYVSRQLDDAITDIWTHQDEYLIAIDGAQPTVRGFPAPPKVTFSGSVTDRNGLVYASPEFTLQGFPIRTQAITLAAPQGIDLSGPVFKTSVHLDGLVLRLRLPRDMPTRFDRVTVAAWQQQGASIPVEKLELSRGSLHMLGDGYLNLDKDLQPAGSIKVKISGLEDLLNELVQAGTIPGNAALLGQSLINLMSQKDPATNVSTLVTALAIQDSGIYIGPMRVARSPEWKWDEP